MRVVGLVRTGFDIGARPDEPSDVIFTPAFLARYGDQVGQGGPSHKVRLVGGPAARSRFADAVEQAYAGADASSRPGLDLTGGERVQSDAIAVITVGLLTLGLVVVIAGLVWIVAAVSRQQRLSAGDLDVLRVLGSTPAERRTMALAIVAPAVVAGLVVVPVVAIVLSPLFPVGLARRFDPDPGVHADLVALGAGVSVLLAAVAGLAVLSAARVVGTAGGRPPLRQRAPADLASGPPPRIAVLADRLGRGLGPAPAAGVRFALAAPRSLSVPVRPALVGAVAGVVGLVGVAVVGTSLDRFVETPARWGTAWDVAIAPEAFGGAPVLDDRARAAVLDDGDIVAAAVGLFDEQLTVDGHELLGTTFDPLKGDLGPTVVDGRAPRGDDEVAVGRETLDQLGVPLGSTVDVTSRSSGRSDRTPFRIVGVVVFPTVGFSFPLAAGATFTAAGGERLALGDPSRDDAGFPRLLVRWVPGVDHDAALRRLVAAGGTGGTGGADGSVFAVDPDLPTAPPEVNGLRDVRLFPAAAAAALVLLGVISTGHALAVTVRRRRAELGVLSARRVHAPAAPAGDHDPGDHRGLRGARRRGAAGRGGRAARVVGHRRLDGRGHRRRVPRRPAAGGRARRAAGAQRDPGRSPPALRPASRSPRPCGRSSSGGGQNVTTFRPPPERHQLSEEPRRQGPSMAKVTPGVWTFTNSTGRRRERGAAELHGRGSRRRGSPASPGSPRRARCCSPRTRTSRRRRLIPTRRGAEAAQVPPTT